MSLSPSDTRQDGPLAYARIDVPVPLAALQAEVDALLAREWIAHVNQRDYRGDWDVLPLRCLREHAQAHPVLQAFAITVGEEWQDLPELDDCPALRGVLASLRCPLRSVRLMRLRAGAEILPHHDHDLDFALGQARLHVPVHTSGQVRFSVAGLDVPMQAGGVWYFNAGLEHAVSNAGDTDRIHVVVDCVTNDWLRQAIDGGGPVFAPVA